MSDEVLNFWCEVGVVFSSVTSRNVFFVCVLDNCIEGVHSCVDVCDESTVQSCEVLFCFSNEFFPVSSFVIGVCVSVSSWGVFNFCGDDDREVVRTEGFDHSP